MKFKFRRASEGYFGEREEREFNTLDELVELMENEQEDLIIERPYVDDELYTIVIYDDYVE